MSKEKKTLLEVFWSLMSIRPRAKTQVTWLLALITVLTVAQSFPTSSGQKGINVNSVSFV